jgi:hypothetical protein
MTRLTRIVNIADWSLSDALRERRERLLDVPQPEHLLSRLITESEEAARRGLVALEWQESCERPGYFRLVAQIPLTETTFDQVFNGRSGYRAHYYLSPEEGVLYNRDILDGLVPAIETAYGQRSLTIEFGLVEKSMRAPHSKMWVFQERAAFDDAAPAALNPPRWVANGAVRGRKAPLPSHHMIDVKGAFIQPSTNALFVDELKLDRPLDLFNRGYT